MGKMELSARTTGWYRQTLLLTGLATFRAIGNPGIIVTPHGAHDQ